MFTTFWDFYSFAVVVVFLFLCGWLLAYCMGRMSVPPSPTERFWTGLIWLAIGFVLFFTFTNNIRLTSTLTACVVAGFVLRSAMEALLRLRKFIGEMDEACTSEVATPTVTHRAIDTRLPNPVQEDYRPGDNFGTHV